ncbi:unnamed protein product [Phytophthora fragariaefolia]|uniref:Unnamed protein product n=1 Tax=Phytophthora fragariaefolia TaxID=1490495 RepID=A0A9W6Y945_9STRA|nr:unnamed protein product [Phytophthora fragariaefolia]
MDDSRHPPPRISLAEASLSEMMAELQVRESKYGRSERSKSRDMRRSLEDSSSEDVEDWSTDDDQSGSDYADPYHSDEHDRHVAAANDAERRSEAIGTLPTETGLDPIGLPQLASPPVDADGVYAFVGESKWLKTQRREEVNEVNTTEKLEKERNGSLGGGENNERRNDEWNGGSSEGLVSSVTQNTWLDYQPENVIKLLTGERIGWWSAQKFDKRVRMRALVHGAMNDARTRIMLDTGANVSVISERFAKQLRMREYELWVMDHGAGVDVVLGTDFTRVMGSEDEGIDTEGCRVSTRPSTAGTSDEHFGRLVTCPAHLPLLLWVPRGDLPRTERYGRLGSDKYNEWRVLVYSLSRDSDLYKVEGEIYQRWLAAQPSVVERVPYTTPTKILRRPSESSEGGSDRDDQAEWATATTEPSTEMGAEVTHQQEARQKPAAHFDRVSEGSEVTQLKLEGAYLAATTVSEDWADRDAACVRTPRVEQQDRVVKDNEVNDHPTEREVLALLLLLKTCYTLSAGRMINAYTKFSMLGWINTSKTLLGRSTQFAVMLSP